MKKLRTDSQGTTINQKTQTIFLETLTFNNESYWGHLNHIKKLDKPLYCAVLSTPKVLRITHQTAWAAALAAAKDSALVFLPFCPPSSPLKAKLYYCKLRLKSAATRPAARQKVRISSPLNRAAKV